jgi:hypothetical protein
MRALRCLPALWLVSLTGGYAADLSAYSERLDPKIARHYEAACTAYSEGRYERALAEINLVLLQKAKVFIDADPNSTVYKQCVAGLDIWSDALGDDNPFELTSDRAHANVVVTFVDELDCDGKKLCGHVDWTRRAVVCGDERTANITASVQVALCSHMGGRHDRASIIHIVAHEFGHILGLTDAANPSDIMGPDYHGHASTTLSDAERTAIVALRDKCRDLRAAAQDARSVRPLLGFARFLAVR